MTATKSSHFNRPLDMAVPRERMGSGEVALLGATASHG